MMCLKMNKNNSNKLKMIKLSNIMQIKNKISMNLMKVKEISNKIKKIQKYMEQKIQVKKIKICAIANKQMISHFKKQIIKTKKANLLIIF